MHCTMRVYQGIVLFCALVGAQRSGGEGRGGREPLARGPRPTPPLTVTENALFIMSVCTSNLQFTMSLYQGDLFVPCV